MDTDFKVQLQDCQTIIENCLGHQDFEIVTLKQRSLSSEVFGIMAGHYSTEIILKVNNNELVKRFFEKRMKSKFEIQNKMIKMQGAFKKENFIYEIFSKQLNNIPGYDTKYMAQCYHTKKDRFFVLEDLKETGYGVSQIDNFLFDLNHCKLAVDVLAKFHAGSIIFEHEKTIQSGEKYTILEEYPDIFHDPLYRKEDNYLGDILYQTGYETVLKLMDLSPIFDNNRNEMKKIFLQNVDHLYDLVKPARDFRNVVCHADLWGSNLLFKYDKQTPIKCKLIDYQALRYTVPAHDLLCLVYSVSNSQFCDKNLKYLIQFYHDALKTHLKKCNINVDDHITMDDLENSCDYVLPMIIVQKACFSLMYSLILHPEIMEDQNFFRGFMYESPKKIDICTNAYKNNPMFKNILDDIFSEFHKLKPVVN